MKHYAKTATHVNKGLRVYVCVRARVFKRLLCGQGSQYILHDEETYMNTYYIYAHKYYTASFYTLKCFALLLSLVKYDFVKHHFDT